MSAPKTLGRWGVLVKPEGAYGTFAAPDPATDGVAVYEQPTVRPGHVHDGSRNGRAPGTVGGLRRVRKSGRFGTVDLVTEAAGAGVAYAANQLPNIHQLLRMAGYDSALDTSTPGAEKVSYTPSPEGSYASASMRVFSRGQQYDLAGCYAELAVEGELGGIPRWSFAAQGIMPNLPVDMALPAITYAGAQLVEPAKAEGINFTLGGVVPARVKSFSYKDARNISARALDNSTGLHGGFNPGAARDVTLSVVVEAMALATMDPYTLAELATSGPCILTVGGEKYERWTLGGPVAQLLDVPEQDEDNAAMWELQLALAPSGLTASDMATITFD